MNISTIPCAVRNGRVRPVATSYWRLVLPGEPLKWGDEYKYYATRYPKEAWPWLKSGCGAANQPILDSGKFLYRRRVKGGKS